jgi:hypothetical protein
MLLTSLVLFFQDGRNYSGQMEFNTLHGQGTLSFPNGTIFRGHFFNGIPSGEAGKGLFIN